MEQLRRFLFGQIECNHPFLQFYKQCPQRHKRTVPVCYEVKIVSRARIYKYTPLRTSGTRKRIGRLPREAGRLPDGLLTEKSSPPVQRRMHGGAGESSEKSIPAFSSVPSRAFAISKYGKSGREPARLIDFRRTNGIIFSENMTRVGILDGGIWYDLYDERGRLNT